MSRPRRYKGRAERLHEIRKENFFADRFYFGRWDGTKFPRRKLHMMKGDHWYSKRKENRITVNRRDRRKTRQEVKI